MRHLPRWNRFGAVIIDFFTVQMFGTLLFTIPVILGFPISFTRTNILVDLLIAYLAILYMVAIAVGYHYICYRKFKGTLGKLLMRQSLVNKQTGERLTKRELVNRESVKWVMFYGTLGTYGLYCLVCIWRKTEMYHERKTNTKIA